VMYTPGASEMYPPEFATRVDAAGVAQPLEGMSRPQFFSGVATVVSKLFLQVQPDVAVFGEKDYQQLQVVKQLVRDLNFPIAIVPGPVMREADGLAMSSRNVYLGPQERLVAAQLYAVLKDAGKELEEGGAVEETVQKGISRLQSHGFRVDYLEVRDAGTLLPVEGHAGRPARLLAAAYLGKVRLIDNIGVSPPAH
jgi:pantoate--beta-alanine ligase